MAWNYTGQQGPVSFDHNATHQFYAPVQQQQQDDQQGLGLDHQGHEQGQGHYTPPTTPGHQQPSSLGFYPNAMPGSSNFMNDPYFTNGYSLNTNQHQQHHQQQQQPHPTYRPSPLSFDSDPASYPSLDQHTPHTSQAGPSHDNGNGGYTHQMATPNDHFDIEHYANLLHMTVPGPRQPQHITQNNNNNLQQYQQQQQQMYDWAHLANGNHHGMPHATPDTPCTDALAEYLRNPDMYGNLAAASLPDHSIPGTISPSQLGQGAINKQFSSLFMERGSTSSASSTEGGYDATATGLMLEDVQNAAAGLRLGGLGDLRTYAPAATTQIPAPAPVPVLGDPDSNDATQAALVGYLTSPNRFAYGERRLVISTPKVGQKSYGNEKRFLCPHPQATLYGAAWWTTQGEGCPATPIVPPRINISLSGEEAVKDANTTWTNLSGKSLDEKISQETILKQDQPFVGNVAGRNLHISDTEGKRSAFTAQVRIRAPSARRELAPKAWGGADLEPREIIGTFESKEIKVISKPSKKKTNTKSSELVITHGSTIALYNRTKSQTASTRYLNVETDLTSIRGSDGQCVTGARAPASSSSSSVGGEQKAFPGMVASAGVWESFIIWLADPTKPNVLSGLPPTIPNGPSPPMNILPAGPIPPPIRYNSLVVLQSLQTGRCTPVMTIRRIDQDTDAVGSDGHSIDHNIGYAPDGELPGDMVAQVQKVAFELYDPILASQVLLNRSSGDSRWLACDSEAVVPRYVRTERRWSPIPIPYRGGKSHSTPTTPNRGFHILPMTPHTSSTNLPSTPSSPVSSGSSLDYFGPHSRKASSTHLMSPISTNGELLPMSTDGGPLRRHRTGSTGTGRAGPLGRPAHKKRQSQDSHSASASSSYDHLPNALGTMLDHRQSWSLSVGDAAVWTIVGTEQVSYTFYVPSSVSVSDNPIAPFPTVTKYLPPGADKNDKRTEIGFTSNTDLPLVHIYGKGFSKIADGPKYDVYFGDHKSRHTEARCEECMAAAEPAPGVPLPAPITLVRKDGRCILPTGLIYDHPPHSILSQVQGQGQIQQTQGQGQAQAQVHHVHPSNQMAPPSITNNSRPRSQYK